MKEGRLRAPSTARAMAVPFGGHQVVCQCQIRRKREESRRPKVSGSTKSRGVSDHISTCPIPTRKRKKIAKGGIYYLLYKERRGREREEKRRNVFLRFLFPLFFPPPVHPNFLIVTREGEKDRDGIERQCRIFGDQGDSRWAGEGHHRHGSRDWYHLFFRPFFLHYLLESDSFASLI